MTDDSLVKRKLRIALAIFLGVCGIGLLYWWLFATKNEDNQGLTRKLYVIVSLEASKRSPSIFAAEFDRFAVTDLKQGVRGISFVPISIDVDKQLQVI